MKKIIARVTETVVTEAEIILDENGKVVDYNRISDISNSINSFEPINPIDLEANARFRVVDKSIFPPKVLGENQDMDSVRELIEERLEKQLGFMPMLQEALAENGRDFLIYLHSDSHETLSDEAINQLSNLKITEDPESMYWILNEAGLAVLFEKYDFSI